MTTPKLILFNGPRHSGKDEAAKYCVQRFEAAHIKMSGPIKAAIKAAFDLSDEEVDFLESIKTSPSRLLFDKSYVDCQISFSEDWFKRFFGESAFGFLARRRVRKALLENPEKTLFVCSDSGFVSEAVPVLELFGPENVLLVRLFREGKSFAGDSRSYIELDGVKQVQVFNNDTIEAYQSKLEGLVQGFIAEEGGSRGQLSG